MIDHRSILTTSVVLLADVQDLVSGFAIVVVAAVVGSIALQEEAEVGLGDLTSGIGWVEPNQDLVLIVEFAFWNRIFDIKILNFLSNHILQVKAIFNSQVHMFLKPWEGTHDLYAQMCFSPRVVYFMQCNSRLREKHCKRLI